MSTELSLASMSAVIAAEVRAEMARQRLTQQALADRLNLTQWWVSRRLLESDKKAPTPIGAAELVLIAEALGVPVGQFLAPVTPAAMAVA